MFEGDPAPGRHEVSVSPKVRFAAHEAAGGGGGEVGRGRHAESMLVLELLLVEVAAFLLFFLRFSFSLHGSRPK